MSGWYNGELLFEGVRTEEELLQMDIEKMIAIANAPAIASKRKKVRDENKEGC